MKSLKLLLTLFCFTVLLTGCFDGGIRGESTDISHDDEITIDENNTDNSNETDNADNTDGNNDDGEEIVLNPEEIELDVDDDGTGNINNPESMSEDDLMDMVDATGELFEEVDGENKGTVKGSCNAIPAKSTCIDYIGSYWSNWEYLKLNCTGPETTPSKNTCPYNAGGGCKLGAGTINEIISWSYCSGGTPICGENLSYQQKACEALPNGTWVTQP